MSNCYANHIKQIWVNNERGRKQGCVSDHNIKSRIHRNG